MVETSDRPRHTAYWRLDDRHCQGWLLSTEGDGIAWKGGAAAISGPERASNRSISQSEETPA
jgi:hypothetical protein